MYSITLTIQETVGAYYVRAWLTAHHDSVAEDTVLWAPPALVDPVDFDHSYGVSGILRAIEEWAAKGVKDPDGVFPLIDSEE